MKEKIILFILVLSLCGCNDSQSFKTEVEQRAIETYISMSGVLQEAPEGLFQTRYDNGQLMDEVCFKNGNIVGTAKYWYMDGTLRVLEEHDSDGQIHGWQFIYATDGSLLKKFYMEHGNGTVYQYENNLLKHKILLKNGKSIKEKTYYPNGMLYREVIYNEENKKISEEYYNGNSGLISSKAYDPSGILRYEIGYDENGKWLFERYFDSSGQVAYERYK